MKETSSLIFYAFLLSMQNHCFQLLKIGFYRYVIHIRKTCQRSYSCPLPPFFPLSLFSFQHLTSWSALTATITGKMVGKQRWDVFFIPYEKAPSVGFYRLFRVWLRGFVAVEPWLFGIMRFIPFFRSLSIFGPTQNPREQVCKIGQTTWTTVTLAVAW